MAGRANPATEETVAPKSEIELLQEELLREQISQLKGKKEIINVVQEQLEKPRKIVFSIRGHEDEDAMFNGHYVYGKSVGNAPFNFRYPLKKDESGSYVTGFEVELISMDRSLTEELKINLIKEVSTARKWLERKYNSSLDARSTFWKDKKVKIDDLGVVYNTERSDDSLMLYYNILGGGYPEIARSYDELVNSSTDLWPKRLYLTVESEEAERSFSHKKMVIKANAALEDIMDNYKIVDALYLVHYLSKRQHGYTLNTSKEILVNELSDFIDGADTKNEKKKRPAEFLEAIKLFKADPDRLRITALFNAALYYGYVIIDKNRNFVNKMSGFQYGSSLSVAIDKLLDPTHIEELSWLKAKIVQEKWVN